MDVSLNGGTPKHPKMIIFSRKTPWLLGTTILGTPHMYPRKTYNSDEDNTSPTTNPTCLHRNLQAPWRLWSLHFGQDQTIKSKEWKRAYTQETHASPEK